MNNHQCKWQEEYYGHRCSICGLFFAFGCAPWDKGENKIDHDEKEIDYINEEEDL